MMCCRVEPHIVGWSWIKYTHLPEPVKLPHFVYRQCGVFPSCKVTVHGHTTFLCDKHLDEPIRPTGSR